MYLIYAVLVLFAVTLFWSAAMISCRRPDAKWYGKEFMQAYFWAPLGASGLLVGVLMAGKAFLMFSPSILELILSVGVLAITVAMYRLLSKRVPPVDVIVAGTETKIIPFGAKYPAKMPAPEHAKPCDNDFKKAA